MRKLLVVCCMVLAAGVAIAGVDVAAACPVSPKERGCENIEWSRLWAVHLADDKTSLPRVLLVGDSICEEYGGAVEAKLAGRMNVDRWTSSFCLTSPCYLKRLESCLTLTKYDIVHFNNGLHSLGSDVDFWEKRLEEALRLVRRLQPKAKIVLVTSTPLRREELTAKARELNKRLTAVARRQGLPINDLFGLLDPVDRKTGWTDDYHHSSSVREQLAKKVAASLLQEMASHRVGDWTLTAGDKISLAYKGRRVLSDVLTGFWTPGYKRFLMGLTGAKSRSEGNAVVFEKAGSDMALELRVELEPKTVRLALTANVLKPQGPFEYTFQLPFDDLAVVEGVPNLRLDGSAVELDRENRFSQKLGHELTFELPEARLGFRTVRSPNVFVLQDQRRQGRGEARFVVSATPTGPGKLVFAHEWTVKEAYDAALVEHRRKSLARPLVWFEKLALENAGFEVGDKAWSRPSNGCVDEKVFHGGKASMSLTIRDPQRDEGVYVTRQVPVVGGAEYRLSSFVKTEDVREATVRRMSSTGAAIIIEWCDKNGKWMQGGDYSRGLYGTNDWTQLKTAWVTAPDDAGFATVFLALRATGKAWFDDIVVERRFAAADKLEPRDGVSLSNNVPRFAWTLRPGVRRSTLELSQDPAFPDEQVRSYAAGGLATFQLEQPLPPGTWYWRVNGKGSQDATCSSFVQTAPIDQDCLPPQLKTEAARVTSSTESFVVRVREELVGERPVVTFEGVTARFVRLVEGGLLEYRLDAPAGGWKPGLTRSEIVCTDRAGNRGAHRFWLLNAPKPSNDAVIAKDGNFAVSGKRFFPLGIYEVAPKYMKEVRGVGFDVVHTYRWEGDQDDAACTKYLDACWQADGLRAFVGFDRRAIVKGDFEHIARRVGAIGAHPGLFCWYLFDEPEIKNQFVAPDQLVACANLIRKLDPYHAVVMSTWNKTMDEYRGSWDTHWTQAYGDPAGVVNELDKHRNYLKNVPSPITLLVNSNDGALGALRRKGLTPDPEKFSKSYDYLRACAFLGIVKSCNGVWWWWFARDTRDYFTVAQAPKAWANLTRIVKELVSLRPVVDAEGPVLAGTVTVGKAKVEWWKKTVAGKVTLIAVNTANEPVVATIKGWRPMEFRPYEVKVLTAPEM